MKKKLQENILEKGEMATFQFLIAASLNFGTASKGLSTEWVIYSL